MKHFLLLTKVQLSALFSKGTAKSGADAKPKKRTRNQLLLIVVLGFSMLSMSASYSFILAETLAPLGQLNLLPAMMALAASVLSLVSALARARSVLFGAADYDMLMSLPLRRGVVTASRLFSFYTFELLFTLVIMLPCGWVYMRYATPDWSFYVRFMLCLPLIPLVPTAVGGTVGTVLAALLAKFRFRNFFYTTIQFVFLLGVFALSMSSSFLMQDMDALTGGLIAAMQNIYPLAMQFARGVCGGDFGALAVFVSVSLGVAAVFCAAVTPCFKWLNTRLSASYRTGVYRLAELRAGGCLSAMYKKEWRRYTASSIYVQNTMFGNIIPVLGALALVFFLRDKALALLVEYNLVSYAAPAAALLLSWFASMGVTTSASISMEGKSLWLSKQLPVPADTWLSAKLLVSMTVSVPTTLVSAALFVFALRLTVVDALLAAAVPLCCIYAFSVFGLWLNLKMPKFDWKNDAEAVKQSTPVMIIALGSMFLFVALAGAAFVLPARLTLLCFALLLFGLALLTRRYLHRHAERLRLAL